MASEAQIEGWAEEFFNLNNTEKKEFNGCGSGVAVSKRALGASTTIQDLYSNINSLTNQADRDTFQNKLNTLSGGGEKSHWPC